MFFGNCSLRDNRGNCVKCIEYAIPNWQLEINNVLGVNDNSNIRLLEPLKNDCKMCGTNEQKVKVVTELGVCSKNLPGGIQHINTQENLGLARLNSVYICEQGHLMVPLEPQTRYDPCWGQWQDGYIVEWLRDEDLLLISMTFYVWPWKHYFLSLTLHSTYETWLTALLSKDCENSIRQRLETA